MIHNIAAAAPEDIADALDALAEETGISRFRWAARVVRGEGAGGRQPVDDSDALTKVHELMARGRSEWAALNIVARRIHPKSPRAAVRRLQAKLKKQGRQGFPAYRGEVAEWE